jgi:hypothetical protein
MDLLKNNNDHFNSENKGNFDFMPDHAGNRGKLSFSELHPWLGDDSGNKDYFKKHSERMQTFRNSHIVDNNSGKSIVPETDALTIGDVVEDLRRSKELREIGNCLFAITENRELHHQFSVN